jgi:hypothetical protein
MRRLVAIALVAGSAASSQAQRVAPIGATAQLVNLDSAMARLPSMPSHIALSLPRAFTATIDDGRQGSVWKAAGLSAPLSFACRRERELRRLRRASS